MCLRTSVTVVSIVLSIVSSCAAATCFACANAGSEKECNARNTTCPTTEAESCISTMRREKGKWIHDKSCEQLDVCESLEAQNKFLCQGTREDALCFQCCNEDRCNEFVEWPKLDNDIESIRRHQNVFSWTESPSFLIRRYASKLSVPQRKAIVRKKRRKLRRKSNRFSKSSIKPAVADAKKKRLKSLLTKRLYVEENDVMTEEVVLFSSSISNMSSASMVMMSAAPTSCGIPNLSGISFVKLGTWPTGASFVVAVTNTQTATQGWTVLVVFPQSLPSQCTFATWVAKIYQEDPSRKAFLLENQAYNMDISSFAEFNITFNLQNCPVGITSSLSAGVAAFYDVSLSGGQCIRQSTTFSSTSSSSTATTTVAAVTTTIASTIQSTASTIPSTASALISTASTTIATTATSSIATTATSAVATTASTSTDTSTTVPITTTATSSGCTQQAASAFMLLGPAFPGYQSDVRSHARVNMTGLQNIQHDSWAIKLVFDVPVLAVMAWQVQVAPGSSNGTVFFMRPQSWYNVLQDIRTFDVLISYNVPTVPIAAVSYCDNATSVNISQSPISVSPVSTTAMTSTATVTTSQTTTVLPPAQDCSGLRSLLPPVSRETFVNFVPSSSSDNLQFDYNEVLHKSLLFYEAQRAGKLPINNRVYWRGDSNLHDGCDVGVDLSGGWYDGAENVKYGFPLASTVTLLAWGMIEFEEGYRDAQEWSNALDNLKWGADYIVKTHPSPNILWGQVGDPLEDQKFWTRPEELTTPRTAYQINENSPGSDLAAESSAALAAASIVFSNDVQYSSLLLNHAVQLYEFANTYRGTYDTSIPSANRVYPSLSGFHDELVWAALWIFKATGNVTYLEDAKQKRVEFILFKRPFDFSWDNKLAGIQVLMANITGNDTYRGDVENFLNHCITGSSVPRTPAGLAYFSNFGTNGYAANAAFIALVASKLNPLLSNHQRYQDFAVAQIHAMLGSGDGGRSYVVGFGNDPPTQPYHAASSCPQWTSPPPICDQSAFNLAGPNPHKLYGALVGGPDQNGKYNIGRKEFANNEVSIYYNAGFQSAVAGLKYFVKRSRNP